MYKTEASRLAYNLGISIILYRYKYGVATGMVSSFKVEAMIRGHISIAGLWVALYPGLPGGGERKDWYILFAHALISSDIPLRLDSVVTCPWNER